MNIPDGLKSSVKVIAAAAVISSSALAGPLTNGGFDDSSGFVPNGDQTMVLNPGDTTMTGWTVGVNQLAWINNSNTFDGNTLKSENGDYFLDLTSYGDGSPYGAVSQGVTTVAGDQYDLSFYVGTTSGLGASAQITASATGTAASAFTATNVASSTQGQWTQFNYDFTASGTSTTIMLAGTATNTDFLGLDAVSLTDTTPVPSTGAPDGGWSLGMLALGLALMAMEKVRRSQQAAS